MKAHSNRARYNQASFLSHEDERCLIERWQSRGEPKALDALIEAFAPLINKELARASKNFDLRTRIRSAGALGVMRALETFEPARELRFGTYAQHWIRRQIKEDSSLELQLVRLLGRHQRVFKEAASIAQHRRVGQFFAADAADGPAYIFGRGLLNALLA